MELDYGLCSYVTWGILYFIAKVKRLKTISFILELPRRLYKDIAESQMQLNWSKISVSADLFS